ncbi:MAG: hypothetical protein GY898_20545 [Proteobacteria bacterium]|nr:hypothetical protein [Pseudomonadota bacterium]
MRKFLSLLTLLVLPLSACGPDPADDDDATGDIRYPFVVEINPVADGQLFYQSNVWAEFDVPPDSASVSIADAGGAAIAGTLESGSNGRLWTFDPTEDLVPGTAYTMTVEWTPTQDAALEIAFTTGPHGTTVDNAPDLVGNVYNIDLAGATFVEPPGVGAIIGSQLDGFAILFTPTEESSFEAADQPGLHIVGALGEESGGSITQEACTETLAFTYGEDGVYGTADDVPAGWNDPRLELGPTDLPLSIQGIEATIQNLIITGTFHPELDDMQGGTFSGRIDTRPLAPELDPDGDEDAICQLVFETVGVECEECGDPNPGPFCLTLVAEDIVAAQVPDLELVPYTCASIIEIYESTGECDEALDYDENADGEYELCPQYDPDGGDDDDSAGDDDDSAGDDDDSAGDDDDSAE